MAGCNPSSHHVFAKTALFLVTLLLSLAGYTALLWVLIYLFANLLGWPEGPLEQAPVAFWVALLLVFGLSPFEALAAAVALARRLQLPVLLVSSATATAVVLWWGVFFFLLLAGRTG